MLSADPLICLEDTESKLIEVTDSQSAGQADVQKLHIQSGNRDRIGTADFTSQIHPY